LENKALEQIVYYENTNLIPLLMSSMDNTSYDVAMQLHPTQCWDLEQLAHLAHDLGPLPTSWCCAALFVEMSPNIFNGEIAAQYQAACCTYIQQAQQASKWAMAPVKDGG